MKDHLCRFVPGILLVGALLGLELLAGWFNPYRLIPPAAESFRNPGHKYGWPEYVSGTEPSPGKLVVFIGNSQAYGIEIQDASAIYFAHLRQHFSRSRQDLRLENWALPGLRTVDLEILTIKAALRGAKYVFLMLSPTNFDAPEQLRLDYPDSDVPLLAGDPSMWPLLGDSLIRASLTGEEKIHRFTALHLAMVRLRTPLYFWLANHVPTRFHTFFFGRPMNQPGEEDFADAKRRARTERTTDLAYRLDTMLHFQEGLNRRFAASGTKTVTIWIPVSPVRLPRARREAMQTFIEDSNRLLQGIPFRSIDLSDAVPPEHFIARSHLDEEGQRLFARTLIQVLEHELQ